MKTRIVVVGILALLLLATLVLIPIYQTNEDKSPPIMLFVLLSAAVGRGVDVASQVQTDALPGSVGKWHLDLAWNLLAAMVFAVVIYLMFQGGIIEGALFPRFKAGPDSYENMLAYMNDVKPATNADTAKVLFWSFISGYSSKFVPNLLTNVAIKSTTTVAVTATETQIREDK